MPDFHQLLFIDFCVSTYVRGESRIKLNKLLHRPTPKACNTIGTTGIISERRISIIDSQFRKIPTYTTSAGSVEAAPQFFQCDDARVEFESVGSLLELFRSSDDGKEVEVRYECCSDFGTL